MRGWEEKRLGEVIDISRERIEPAEYTATTFNYIGLENIESNTGGLLPYEPTPGYRIKSTKNVFKSGEVLYGKLRPYLNKVYIATTDGICSTDIFVLKPRQNLLNVTFAGFFLRSPVFVDIVSNLMVGANLPRINQDAFLNIPLPLPEQERIVALLDEADELRKLRAQADRRSAELIPALFEEMFGDPLSNPKRWPIKNAGELMAACDYGTSQKANEDGRGITVLRMGNVTYDGNLDLTNLKTVELPDIELEKQRLKVGDVLFNRTNSRELVGKTGLWDGRFEAVAASYFIRLRFRTEEEHPQHFTTFMNLPSMKKRIAEIARGAVGQANINSKELQAILLPVPPLPLQQEFASRGSAIRALASSQSSSRENLDALFQSMLHRAFRGEL